MTHVDGPTFADAWRTRIRAPYGRSHVNWINLDGLIDIKGRIDVSRHQADVRDLLKVRDMLSGKAPNKPARKKAAGKRKRTNK